MMDKKTIGVVALCLVALMGWQWLVSKLYPPVPKTARPPVISTVTNDVTPVAATPVATAPTAPVAPAAVIEPERPRPPEQIAVLENDFVRVTFTTWGGGIRSVELLKHRLNGDGKVLLNTNGVPALAWRGSEHGAYDLTQPTPDTVVFRGGGGEKRFTLGKDYVVHATFLAPGATSLPLAIGTTASLDRHEAPDLLVAGWLVDTKYHKAGVNKTKDGPQHVPASIRWGAVQNQYFTMVLTPTNTATAIHYESAALPPPPAKPGEPTPGIRAWLEVPVDTNGVAHATYYAGPKELKRLRALGRGQEETMDFGFFGIISLGLLWGMNFFHNALPNYGVAIILVTVCIKILFWPIQAKSIQSMKEMQKFQPVMAKLKEKYKDDPQKMNAEMMRLYKEHKINPFAGCLPMVVQIPVFFAFYTMLRSAVELRGASFLWIHDLAQPDTIARLAGLPINPLPLVMGASMIWQMKLTPQTGDSQQQKIMMFMPLIFLFICYNMASGLVLYWTVQQLLSIAQQWWSLRQPDAAPVVLPAKPK